MTTRILYSDLDGTMVGPGGCLVRAADRSTTLDPTEALIALHDAGVLLSLVSGRTRAQLQEAARIFGADGFIAEMGAIIGWDHGRRSSILTGETPQEFAGPLVAQLESLGLIDALLAECDGRLEHHAPWHLGHETDVMTHGLVDVDVVNKWLDAEGFGWLVLADNGRLNSTVMGGLDGPPHIYHLMARGISKGAGVAVDLERRGLTASDAVAVGDSLSDLEMAPFVERFFLVANGAEVPDIRAAADALPNVTICVGPLGAGWAQAARYCVR
ncbi:MAG: HAD hydrolase family protein [Actinomycetia bacterium]|nr:HAD hydrolase family protein [Actinomycetes bacterium]